MSCLSKNVQQQKQRSAERAPLVFTTQKIVRISRRTTIQWLSTPCQTVRAYPTGCHRLGYTLTADDTAYHPRHSPTSSRYQMIDSKQPRVALSEIEQQVLASILTL